MGETEQTIVRQAIRFGNPIPDRIANAPDLMPGLELYLEAFFDLNTERSHNFGLTYIPWSSIKNYAEFYEFSTEQTEALFFHIKKMDIEHVKRLKAKQPK